MGELLVTRWRRYGHDRLYVKALDGSQVGWVDVGSGKMLLQADGQEVAFRSAVAEFCRRNGIDAPAQRPEAAKESVADEAQEWLAANAAAAHEPFAIRIDWRDTARNRPGERAEQQAAKLRAEAPVRTFVAKVLGVHTDERAWRIGAAGERHVAGQLLKLDTRWHLLHAVEVGNNGSDIDHIAIGPAGVFTINAKHHPGAKVWVGGNTVLINGHRQPYVRNAQHEASRASRLLGAVVGFEVPVHGVVAVVGAADFRVEAQPHDVAVLAHLRLRDWLWGQPPALGPDAVDTVVRAARKSTTWSTARR